MSPTSRIVGLGGAHGATPALDAFFRQVPAKAGVAYVILGESVDVAALARDSVVPIVPLHETTVLQEDHGYVVPDGHDIDIADGVAKVAIDAEDARHGRIDRFFRSLAQLGKECAAIVLSGEGADGTLGLKQIKEQGGLTVAQEPLDAEKDAMPRSAIATGLVDIVAPAGAIPERLTSIFRSPLPDEAADEQTLREILTLVRLRSGHDFTQYKRATLNRRVARRMQVCAVDTVAEYLRHVREHPAELTNLQRDFLISVTHFFRDPEVWAAFDEHVLANLFESHPADQPVRVWCAGCATGEEAYTLAILCAERAARLDLPPAIQIFATDIDDDALAEARAGRYPDTIANDVTPHRLARFFTRDEGHYRVKKEIRETVLFSAHNLLRDPPFSRLDLVTCRNLLIYLDRGAQDRVLGILHFALRPDGYLLLGSSESAENAAAWFGTVDGKHRISVRRPASTSLGVAGLIPPGKWPSPPPPSPSPGERGLSFGELHHRLVEHYAAPSLLVNDELDIVHVSERAGRYLTLSGGEPTRNLLRLVHPDLALDLRAAIYAARARPEGDTRTVRLALEGKDAVVQISVRAFDEPGVAQGMLLVIFDEHLPPVPPPEVKPPTIEPVVRQLEDELHRTREHLRSTIEQYETSVEELKASNEELQAINEELRSATEELETSKEELQSVNEELTTLNSELKDKVDEVSRANGDLQNLMTSTEIAVLFLDRGLRINRFTARAQDIFNVIPSDRGRPLSHLTHRLETDQLEQWAGEVLQTLRPIERELRSKSGRHYLARVHPYRSVDDRIEGVVLTFLDITELEQAEERVRATERMLRLAERAAEAGIWRLDSRAGVLEVSRQLATLYGLPDGVESVRLGEWLEHLHEGDRERVDAAIRKAVTERSELDVELRILHPGTGLRWLWMTGRTDDAGSGMAGVAIDITSRRATEAALRASEERFRLALRTAPVVMLAQDRDLRYTWGYMLGNPIDFIGKSDPELFPPEQARRLTELKRGVLETGIGRRDEVKLTLGGREHHYDLNLEAIRDENGEINGVSSAAVDVTPSKLAELTLRDADRKKDEFLATLAHELRNPLAPLSAALDIQKLAGDDVPRVERARGIAARQVQHLVRLVDDLLDVSRITVGKIHLRMQMASVRSIVDAAIEATQSLFETAGHHLTVEVPDGVEIEGDAMRLTQVVTNLLSNAAKYTPAGGHIAVRGAVDGDQLILSVTDDGVGIDPAILPHIFELFAQAERSAGRAQGGLGIGLALVRRLVELHGGTVTAHSEGVGSELVVRIPLRQGKHPMPARPDPRGKPESGAPRRVLVVDDNPDVTQTVADLLRMIGHEVHVAGDGPEALALAAQVAPDVALLDLGLPGMSGLELARRLRALPGGREMILVAVTGWGQPDDLARTREAGFDHHLVKPAGVAALREILGDARQTQA